MKFNKDPITAENCQDRVLIFFPEDEAEAAYIIYKLISITGAKQNDKTTPEACVRKGMNLDNGVIYAAAPQGDIERGYFCTSQQFDTAYVSQERAEFNALSARISDIAAKVEAIYAQTVPAELKKQRLKNSGGDIAP